MLSLAFPQAVWDFDWVGESGYEWDGLEPDYFEDNREFVFRIKVKSPTEPIYVFVNIDRNADGFFARHEQIPMKLERVSYEGYIYRAGVELKQPRTNRPIGYYFSAQVGCTMKTSPLNLGPFWESRVSFTFIGDTIWTVQSPVLPLEYVINSPDNRFLFVNTGDVPLTFGLMVSEQSNTIWYPAKNYEDIQDGNKYIFSAMFLEPSKSQPKPENFNAQNWEDVLTYMPRFADGEQLGFANKSAGEKLASGDTVALWFNFMAPVYTSINGTERPQSILVRIFAIAQ